MASLMSLNFVKCFNRDFSNFYLRNKKDVYVCLQIDLPGVMQSKHDP